MFNTDHRLLTADEEIDLAMRIEAGRDAAARIAAGDEDDSLPELVNDGLTARDTLFTHNVRLVYMVARKFGTYDTAVTFEDLVQEGSLGLLTAIDKYDWRRGNRFTTLAWWWVRQSIGRFCETTGTIRTPANPENFSEASQAQMARARHLVEMDAPIPGKDRDDRTLADLLPAPHNTEEEVFNRLLVDQAFHAPMPERWRDVLRDFMAGYTYEEAGKRHGLGRSLGNLAVRRMRAYFEAYAVFDEDAS